MKGRDIVIVGQQAWDTGIGSNAKNIAETFSLHNRVLYINAPLDRKTLYLQRQTPAAQRRLAVIEGKKPGLEQVKDNLWVFYPNVIISSINWLPFSFLFDLFNLANNKKIARTILGAMAELGFKDIVLFNDNDMFRSFYLPDLLQPKTSIYYSRDNMLAVDYWARHGKRIEPLLMQKSSICMANSTYLANLCRQHNPRSFYIGQGCDLTMFQPDLAAPAPADLATIPSPRVGYVGALLEMRLDLSLLEQLAKVTPTWQYVFVGPEDESFQASVLHQLPNVHFLGAKSPEELPAYIHSFDVCLNPQHINPITIGNYPRKIDEYLAMGKPTVATATPFMQEVFGEVVFLAEGVEAFQKAITAALAPAASQDRQARIDFAHAHSWENCVAAIYQHVADFENHSIPQP